MKTISEKQNEPQQIKRLKAQRRLYDVVRFRKTIRIIGILIINAIWVFCASHFLHSEIIMVIGSGFLVLIEYLLKTKRERPIQEKAAYIQELFDCYVLEMKWNDDLLDDPPMADEIEHWAARYNEKKYRKTPLNPWYASAVDTIPLSYGRLCCINSNLEWDIKLRNKYLWFFGSFIFISILLFIYLTIQLGSNEIDKYFLFFASITPLFRIGGDETVGNLESKKELKYLLRKFNHKWNEIKLGNLSEIELDRTANNWQIAIINHRKNSPVLPGCFYKQSRKKQDNEMNRSSGALADDLNESLFKKS